YANNITSGRSATKFDPDGVVDEMQFLTFMLRAIGYKDAEGDFVWNNPFALAKKIGMNDSDSAAVTFVRGDAFRISFNALYATAKNGNAVYTNLINAGVFTYDSLDKAASAALSAVEPNNDKPSDTVIPDVPADPEGYNVISKSDYYDKTLAGFMSNIVGVLTGYEHVYRGGVPMVALPEEWYKGLLKGPYAEANENNQHADHLLYNEETKLWEVWTDDDYSIDILNQYVIRDSYAKYGVITSDGIQNAWIGYNQWDMGGGHRSSGAYGLSAKLGYMPPFTGRAEFGNLYSTIGEPIIENETLGMDAAGMPNVAFDLTSLFSDHVADSDANPWAEYLSAMYAMAYFETDIPTMIRKAQSMLPADSYEYKLIDESFKLYEKYPTDWRKAVTEADSVLLREHYCRERMSENSINGPIMTLALLYANGGYEETCKIIGLAGHGGESAAASALGIIGVMQGWENLEANAKPIVNEFIYQDGKGVVVNLPLPDVKQIYWMHAEELPERILITDIVKMYQANFEKILLENGGKIEGDKYYIPKYRIYEAKSVFGDDFESGKLGSFVANGNASVSENFYSGKYALQVNGGGTSASSAYTTLSGLTVGAQYKISAYINATTKTTAHLFAREVGAADYSFVTVASPARYALRTFIFTATAPTMEIGLAVPAGVSEFKYATMDDIVVVRALETVEAPKATVALVDGKYNININGNATETTGKEVYLKVYFANTAASIANAPMTLAGEEYATIPFYSTGETVNANSKDATYIPIVLRGENTAVTLAAPATLQIKSAEIVTITDRW
ncbi:MAG: carbohydrate binding domain-containing protein, partial [Clostridia bacterium]|nr:carbohydrate binding domain-containing protein [Clostridia bacterium]